MTIKENVEQILGALPAGVELVAAIKGRRLEDILTAVESGVKILGENYLQETGPIFEVIGGRVQWHFIGHLQKNKAKKAVQFFDMIETVDSLELAEEISQQSLQINKIMPVLIEINSGLEIQKHGVFPEQAESLIKQLSPLPGIKVKGLMTMGPVCDTPEKLRQHFAATGKLFDHFKQLGLSGVEMKYLSMGMSTSYRIAVEEGANIVRIGSKIFGQSGI